MGRLKTVCLTLYVVLCYFQAQGADKYTDENRPYEFGFTIDGEQHRHEKKDENGIIMGEFGFITADGVYHVTVYATDENGNFKIISMKNIRVKPYPTGPDIRSSTERKGHSLPLSTSQQSSTQQISTPRTQPTKQQSGPIQPAKLANALTQTAKQQSGPFAEAKQQRGPTQPTKQQSGPTLKSCSHCKVPSTTTTTLRPEVVSSAISNNYNKQLQMTGNVQKYNNQQIYSQYENSQAGLQSVQPKEQYYQQGSISGQSEQNIPSQDQSYPNQAVNVINQEQSSQLNPSQQNYQDDFNVGRKYLQKSQGQPSYQQQPSVGPNSLDQSNAGINYQQGFNVQQQQQGLIDGQYHLQPPYVSQDEEQVSTSQRYPQQGNTKVQNLDAPQNYPSSAAEQNYFQGSNSKGNQYGQSNEIHQNEPKIPEQTNNAPINPQAIIPGDREPKTFTDILQSINPEDHYGSVRTPSNSKQNTGQPVLVAAQMQVVNKNTDISLKKPGENEGLPKGVTQGDVTDLLYTFNYTLGFHAHHEEGYKSGAKIGYYYVTGRNGIRTRVDYVADETGFHPRISQEVLDIQSEDVPKPETEKDEKYGLKGYEFKWIYYPVDSK